MASTPRKPERMLTAEQEYDLWLRMPAGRISRAGAAAEAGVGRSVIAGLRAVGRGGAIAALGASRSGRPRRSRREAFEAAALRAEAGRLQATVAGQAVELAALGGKSRWG